MRRSGVGADGEREFLCGVSGFCSREGFFGENSRAAGLGPCAKCHRAGAADLTADCTDIGTRPNGRKERMASGTDSDIWTVGCGFVWHAVCARVDFIRPKRSDIPGKLESDYHARSASPCDKGVRQNS